MDYLPLVFLLSLVPTIELRGSIPILIALSDIHPALVLAACTALNILVVPLTFIGLDLLASPLRRRYRWVNSVFAWFLRRGKRRRWSLAGLALFVAVPLPVTGAYTGTLLAYLLGMNRRHATLAIAAGVIIAGVLVTLATLGIISLIKIL